MRPRSIPPDLAGATVRDYVPTINKEVIIEGIS